MKKLKTLIVEDEEAPLKRLVSLLHEHAGSVIDIDALHCARSFEEAEEKILIERAFDLSILDRGLNGQRTCFDLIKKCGKEHFGMIVLNTKDEQVKEIISDINVLSDYLVLNKPYNYRDVLELVRILEKRQSKSTVYKPLLLDKGSVSIQIKQRDIVYVEVNGNYTDLYYWNGEKVDVIKPMSKQLNYFESLLDPEYFYRISAKHLINLNFIKHIEDGSIELSVIYSKGKIQLPLTEKYRRGFFEKFQR